MAAPTRTRGARALRISPWWAALAILAWLLAIGIAKMDSDPRASAVTAALDTGRVLLAAILVFGVTGFGVTRRLLPDTLKRHELLWILPVGACVTGLSLMALGFAAVPFVVALIGILIGGAFVSWSAFKHTGAPALKPFNELAWPTFLALCVFVIAITPIVAQLQFAGVSGNGSDAHVAAGAGNFLQHAYPTSVDESLPVDRMPLLWKSKYPIYYAFGAVAKVSGLESWQALVPLIAVLLALAAIGMFLVAREVLGAPLLIALFAMGFAGFDREVLHTGLNPYFNQTWGYMAMPFTLVLSWWLVRPGETSRKRTAGLLAIFFGVVALSYPLAAPIPGLPLLAFLFLEWRRRKKTGGDIPRVRDLYRGPRSLLWMVPAALVLMIPVLGILEKVNTSWRLAVDPSQSLMNWAGDLRAFIPANHFFNLPDEPGVVLLVIAIVVLAFAELRRQPRELFIGLGVLFAFALIEAISFRNRDYGYYFHFKILAFVAPLLIVIATVSVGRFKRAGVPILVLFAIATGIAARQEVMNTGQQLGQDTVVLADWATGLPTDASIRLDMPGGDQLWAGYFLASRKVCSTHPLYPSDYPRVAFSRKADYALLTADQPVPFEAVGDPVKQNVTYRLYRLDPGMPGTDTCSRAQRSRVGADDLG